MLSEKTDSGSIPVGGRIVRQGQGRRSSVRQTGGLETVKSSTRSLMEYSPVACMRQSSRCCQSDRLGCLPRNAPLVRAMAMPSLVRVRMRSASNFAKVVMILWDRPGRKASV